ncbi:MAG: HAD-IIB family hydrolase [Bacteriovoracaceae bacterium]
MFSDFDGTLTDGSYITSKLFEVIKLCEKNRLPLIIVSGRSLSWGHFFLSHLPLSMVVMEGGGIVVHKNQNNQFDEYPLLTLVEIDRLKEITLKLKTHFKNVPLSKDSYGRLTDQAIELDLINKNPTLKKEILDFFQKEKVNYSASNVHINFWIGTVSKAKGVEFVLSNFYKNILTKECLFFGDAPNDESMFNYFENSVGVSNIEPFLKNIKTKPKIILEGENNQGINGVLSFLEKSCK